MAAGAATTTTATGGVNTSYIVAMLDYAIDPVVAMPHLRMEPISQYGTKTAAFPIATKDTITTGITEGTAQTHEDINIANTTVAVSEVGVLRTITKLLARSNVMGEAGIYQWAIEDGVKLCLDKFEVDAWAQWANASTSTGTSGATMTIANLAGAISQLTINKAVGPYVGLLSSFQARDLRAQIVSSTATVLEALGAGDVGQRAGDDGYLGMFMGVPLWTSNNAAASGGDKIGVVMVDGQARPQNASTGVALGWMPEPEVLGAPEFPGRQITVTAAYGLAEVADFNYVKIVTVGS